MHNVSYIKKGEIYTNIILNKLKYYQGSPLSPSDGTEVSPLASLYHSYPNGNRPGLRAGLLHTSAQDPQRPKRDPSMIADQHIWCSPHPSRSDQRTDPEPHESLPSADTCPAFRRATTSRHVDSSSWALSRHVTPSVRRHIIYLFIKVISTSARALSYWTRGFSQELRERKETTKKRAERFESRDVWRVWRTLEHWFLELNQKILLWMEDEHKESVKVLLWSLLWFSWRFLMEGGIPCLWFHMDFILLFNSMAAGTRWSCARMAVDLDSYCSSNLTFCDLFFW